MADATDTLHAILIGAKAALAAAAAADPEPISKTLLLGASEAIDLIEALTKQPDPVQALADLKTALAASKSERAADAADLAAREQQP